LEVSADKASVKTLGKTFSKSHTARFIFVNRWILTDCAPLGAIGPMGTDWVLAFAMARTCWGWRQVKISLVEPGQLSYSKQWDEHPHL